MSDKLGESVKGAIAAAKALRDTDHSQPAATVEQKGSIPFVAPWSTRIPAAIARAKEHEGQPNPGCLWPFATEVALAEALWRELTNGICIPAEAYMSSTRHFKELRAFTTKVECLN